MCCFSRPVERVSDTDIFARSDNVRQLLVYSMSYAAATELAMVLPLPVPPGASEDAVRFISLQRYPTFFDDLRRGFPPRLALSRSPYSKAISLDAPKLRVHEVGDFEASFVPRIEDFDRLDERFRIPADTWARLPVYHDYGFAVFKLKASPSRGFSGILRKVWGGSDRYATRVHPMAFSFPRRDHEHLYFPTVHIHDREMHPDAMFDHMLYCQPDAAMEEYLQDWERSRECAGAFVEAVRSEGIVDPDRYCWRLPLYGLLRNRDTSVGKRTVMPGSPRDDPSRIARPDERK